MGTTRKAGVLLHVTSLPGPYGIGDVGARARRFVDWLVQARIGVWQILPLVPPGPGQSPYGTAAALAGSPQLIDLEALAEAGLLTAEELEAAEDDGSSTDRARWEVVLSRKEGVLRKAARRLVVGSGGSRGDPGDIVDGIRRSAKRDTSKRFHGDSPSSGASRAMALCHHDLETFRAAAGNAWAEEAATFFVLKQAHGGAPWWEWPEALKRRDPTALRAFVEAHGEAIAEEVALLFLFEIQWAALKRYANERGVEVFGDLPIYVALDSVDVWSAPEQFALDEDLRPREVAGVPPDYFSETGQLWGNPLYDWGAMAADGHRWWARRIARALELYDLVRIDHFRAFAGYWAIPADAPDATHGCWRPGPGRRLFDDVRSALGRELPLVAEDLGMLDESVHALRKDLGMPGMVILQFAFGGEPDHIYLPHMHRPDQIAYTGTHDNDTTLGYWQGASEEERHRVRSYLGVDGNDVVWDLIRAAMHSAAGMAVIPMQDLLALDSGGRFNTPGTADGNWAWRVRASALSDELAGRVAEVVAQSDRAPE